MSPLIPDASNTSNTSHSSHISSIPEASSTLVEPSNDATASPVVANARRELLTSFLHMPRNVYLLYFFTLGKGFQLTIAMLNISYYAHSLGYKPDFIGLLNAMSAVGALLGAVPAGFVADRFGRKPILVISAILTPLFLAITGLMTSAPLLLGFSLIQGTVATAYWVTNIPLLTESTTERQRVGVLAMNSFLLLGVGAFGNLIGGAIPELVGSLLHTSAASTIPLRFGVLIAALITLLFGIPLWWIQEPSHKRSKVKETRKTTSTLRSTAPKTPFPYLLFVKLLLPDLMFTMGEGAVVALMQLYFVLRFHLLPGPLGVIFTVSGIIGGVFSLTAPLFVKRWGKLRLITFVQYVSAPLMILIGFAPTLPLAITGEYTRSFLRALIDPVYAAFAMENVSDQYRARLSGLYSTTWSIGFSVGPGVAGWLQTNVSLSASFVFGASCLVIAPTLLLLFFGRKRVRKIVERY